MQTRLLQAGFAISRVLGYRPRGNRAVRAAHSARTVSVHQVFPGSNRVGHQRASGAFTVCVARSAGGLSNRLIRRETKRRRARFLTLVFGAGKIQWEERR